MFFSNVHMKFLLVAIATSVIIQHLVSSQMDANLSATVQQSQQKKPIVQHFFQGLILPRLR